jgi:hypothetical protein
MSRFVRPQTRTLTLANGDQLIVREQLTAGEQRAHFARVYTTSATGRLIVNPLMVGIGVVLAYLLDWTLRDDAGQLVAIRDLSPDDLQRVIDSLDTESFQEIRAAVEAHEAAMVAARTEKKTTPTGGPPL